MPARLSRLAFAVTLLAAALLLPAFARAATAPAARNLLHNPGFESPRATGEWMPADWDSSESGVSTVFFGRDSFFVHGGRWSVNIANMSTYLPLAHYWGQNVVVGREAWGKDVVLRVWTRSNGLAGRAYVAALVYRDTVGKMARVWNVSREEARERLDVTVIDDPMMDVGWGRKQFTDARTDWVLREVRAHVPTNANLIAVRLGLFGTGQVLFDDASLTIEPAKPVAAAVVGQNVVAEGGFEGESLAWELSAPPYDGAEVAVDSTTSHGGRRSLRISGGREGLVSTRMGPCQSFPGRQLAGKRVRMSAWLKGDSLETVCYLKMYATGPRGRAQSPGTELYSSTFDWKEASLEWDVPHDTDLVWAWVIKNVPAPGTLWVDDVKLEVIGPSREVMPAATRPRATGATKKR